MIKKALKQSLFCFLRGYLNRIVRFFEIFSLKNVMKNDKC